MYPSNIFFKKICRMLLMGAVVLSVVPVQTLLAAEAPPQILAFQGRLANSGGDLLGSSSGTTYYFKFSLWDNATVGSGSRVWPASAPTAVSATVRQGVFAVNIGDTANSYPDALNIRFADYSALYLQIEVSSDNSTFETLSPRQRLTASAFAQSAASVTGTGASTIGTTTQRSATATIAATSSAMSALALFGANSQTADLFSIWNSALSKLFYVDSGGGVFGSSTLQVTGAARFYDSLTTANTASSTNLIVSSLGASAGDCLTVTTSGQLTTTSCSGSGSTFAFPYTTTTNFGTTVNATSTRLWFQNGLYASSTSQIAYASTTAITATTASTSDLIASNTFTFSNVSGFLKATAGAVATALIDLASDVTGILPVGNGGTGWAAVQSGAVLYGNGSSALATTSAGTAGNVLALLGGVPTWTATTTFSSPLSYSQGVVSIPAASASQNGYLSSSHWSIFNNKISSTSLSAGSGISYDSSTGVITNTNGYPFPSNATTTALTFNASTTLQNFTAVNSTSTSATTTNLFATTASSTNLSTSNLTLARVTGFLKATAGAVATALVDLANDVTGVLGVANGGTGWASLQAGTVLLGNGTSAVATTSAGTAGQILALAGGTPTWVATTTFSSPLSYAQGSVSLSTSSLNIAISETTGTLAVNRGGTGATSLSDLIALGSHTTGNYLATLSSSGSITVGGSGSESAAATVNLNLGNANSWTAHQIFSSLFGTNASSTNATSTNLAISGIASGNLIKTTTGGLLTAAIAGTDYENPLTFTYPISRLSNTISLAFGTTTSNTWAGTQTFTNAPVLSTFSGLVGANSGATYAVATGTVSAGSGITVTGSQYIIGSGLTITNTNGYPFPANATTTQLTLSGGASTTNITASGLASTSQLVASTAFTFSNVSGFLKATAGAVATALIDLASDVTGILPVGNGGTGWAAVQSGAVLYGNGSSALATTSAGTAGNVLALLGGVPTWTATTTFSSPLSYSQGVVSIPAASASQNGYLSSSHWSIFNNKISSSSLSATFPLAYDSSTGAFTFGGLSTSSAAVVGNIPYFSGANTFANVATSSLAAGTGLSVSSGALGYQIGGSNATIGLASIAANSVLANSTGAAAVPTAVATSSLFQNASSVLTGLLSSAHWSIFNNKISSTSLSAGSGIAYDSATGVISSTAGGYPFTPTTNFGATAQATTGIAWFQNGVQASSTARFVYASSTALTISGTASTLLSTGADGGVQSTTVSSPLSFSGSTLSITQANSSTNGYLSSADWTIFNQKVSSSSLDTIFPFTTTTFGATTANATSTLVGFTNGIYALASSTIGSGAAKGGLTVSGGATTTGNLYIAGTVGVGVVAPSYTLDVNGDVNVASGSCFKVNGVCIGYVKRLAAIYSNGTAQTNQSITFGTAATAPGSFTGTLTLPATTTEIVVEVWGAGGGGGGGSDSSSVGGSGSVGGSSCFGTNATACTTPLVSASSGTGGVPGGAGAPSNGGSPGSGGSGSSGNVNLTGQGGGAGDGLPTAGNSGRGGGGGSAPRGGGGGEQNNNGAAFGGGAGGGSGNSGSGGGGGGGGGYAMKLIKSPSGSYTYTTGAGGAAGSAGGAAAAGGTGGAGGIVVTVYATSSPTAAGNDYAEMFPVSNPGISAGDIVSVDAGEPVSMQLAQAGNNAPLAGIIATNPGQLLGDINAQGERPVALMGRVPTKVNLENGPIAIGDRIMLSSVPGVGKRAGKFDPSVGIAIETFEEGDEDGLVMVFIDLQTGTDIEALGQELLKESIASSANAFDFVSSLLGVIADRFFGAATSTAAVDETLATSTEAAASSTPTLSPVENFFKKLFVRIAEWLADTANGIMEIFARRVTTEELCVADTSGATTCITKSQLDALLFSAGQTASVESAAPGEEAAPEGGEEQESVPESSDTQETVPEGQPQEEVAPQTQEEIPVSEPTPTPGPEVQSEPTTPEQTTI